MTTQLTNEQIDELIQLVHAMTTTPAVQALAEKLNVIFNQINNHGSEFLDDVLNDSDIEVLRQAALALTSQAGGEALGSGRVGMYERMYHAAIGSLAEISAALRIPDDVAMTANGNTEMLFAISTLQARQPDEREPCPCMDHGCFVGDHPVCDDDEVADATQPEPAPVVDAHGGRPMTLRECVEAEEHETERTGVPDGWQLVPVVATNAMADAGVYAAVNAKGEPWCPIAWTAMLTAAPQPVERAGVLDDVAERCRTYPSDKLLNCALEVYARSCMYDTKAQHDAAMAYKDELLRRLTSAPRADSAEVVEGMESYTPDDWRSLFEFHPLLKSSLLAALRHDGSEP